MVEFGVMTAVTAAVTRITFVVGPFTENQLIGGLLLLVGVGLGFAGVYFGSRNLARARSIWSSDPIPAASVADASGTVEVTGQVSSIGEPLRAQYSKTPSVIYTYKREERRERRNDEGETEIEWETVDSGERRTAFAVTDESGSVAVDPSGAAVSLKSTKVSGRRQYQQYEERLEPGDDVHVFGQKIESPDAPGEDPYYIGAGDDGGRFTISDAGEFRTVLRFGVKGMGSLLGGLAIWAIVVVVIAFEVL